MGHSSQVPTATASAAPVAATAVAPPPAGSHRGAAAVVWRAVWTSRLVVLVAGVLGVLQIGVASGASAFDPGRLTSLSGYFGNLLAAPFARWDSVWYLTIAHFGYGHQVARTAYFPLYPLLLRALGLVIGSDLLAGVVVSLASFSIALLLLHRLCCLEIGRERADVCVMLIALCPMAYFFSAVYTESLFLALSLGCILCARTERWAAAGGLGALAAATRNSGIVLVVPVVLMFLYGPRSGVRAQLACGPAAASWRRRLAPRYRIGPRILWAALIPLGLAAYVAYLGIARGDALGPLHAEALWYHRFAGPFGGVWTGTVAAFDGLRQLLHGSAPPVYFRAAAGDPLAVAGENLMLWGFLALGAVALVGVFLELPFAYGAYTLVSLALPLSDPVTPQPLNSLPRYELVLFPLFMWAASLLVRRRHVVPGIASVAVLLGLFTAEFATWRFVA